MMTDRSFCGDRDYDERCILGSGFGGISVGVVLGGIIEGEYKRQTKMGVKIDDIS